MRLQHGGSASLRGPPTSTSKQVSYSGKPEDDNYLALSDSQSNALLNGNFVVAMFKREINFKGSVIEYSGSDTKVLCVGNLYNPDVRYSFHIPIEEHREQFVWEPSGSWQECSRMCQGVRRRKAVCVRKSDHLEVSDQRWHAAGKSECSAKCGPGYRSVDVQCMKYSLLRRQSERSTARACAELPKPQHREPCHGDLCPWAAPQHSTPRPNLSSQLQTQWRYGSWTTCTQSCGGGQRTRLVVCQRRSGQRLGDRSCDVLEKPPDVERCNLQPCAASASWHRRPWKPCAVTCGHGYQMRAVRCVSGAYGDTVDDRECNAAARPRDSQCSVSCGKGRQERYVSCRDALGGVADESYCAHLPRPPETSDCFSPCGQWRAGEWSACSSTCAGGFQRRVVVCQDADGRSNSYCDERVKPAEAKSCDSGPCPLWNFGIWGENPEEEEEEEEEEKKES
ncbi:hypothetical protein CRUP_015278 [Coryphaenoides rupestris]|nr:hypothetical protein CRUP_015278 [Coryphaenoides rupestris]